jgi:hypothetical protein
MGAIGNQLSWTPDAQARLENVPEGMMRDLTRQRVEKLARQRGLSVVSGELIEDKYHQWAQGSVGATSEMAWTEDATKRMERIPAFVRGMVVQAVEAYARSEGHVEVTPSIVDEAKGFWRSAGSFHRP